MGNSAMCKVCGSDKGLRTGSRSHLDQNALPDYYCEDHCPVQTPLSVFHLTQLGDWRRLLYLSEFAGGGRTDSLP
ncbi:hypothetical protein NQZ68_033941 [Dissostichus eleginoides]|nr:hypothetical protein NQZ68_033941 [Dissostichus eleginoides]